MKTLTFVLFLLAGLSRVASAQNLSDDIQSALKADDPSKLAAYVTQDHINDCYTEGEWQYTLLAQSIRYHAKKCFDLLIAKGADVNKACEGYVPPLMHAAKYGSLDMVKVLVAKGADVNYKYSGDYQPADGQTPLSYAEANNQPEIAAYLKSLQK